MEEIEINTRRQRGREKRQAEKQTEVEKRGRVTRGEKEQKMDTVSQYGKGGGEKGMGGWMSGTQMGERKVGNNKSDGWK